MQDRSARLAQRAPAAPSQCVAVAVASGAGMAELFAELGATVVDGGATMNPSTRELLAGLEAAGGGEALLLPNSANVLLAAERAAAMTERPVSVVPTRAQQEGLAALLAFDAERPAADNAGAVAHAASELRIGGIAAAGRTDPQGRFAPGDALGYSGEELIAWGAPEATLRATLAAVADGTELLTCFAGQEAPLGRAAVEAVAPAGVELEYQVGGQPAWWWLLCAE